MLSYDLIRVFRPIIVDGLADLGITSNVLLGYQTTLQGHSDNTVYFYEINSRPIGTVKRSDYWDDDTQVMTHEETQLFESTFQINTLLKQDPTDFTITALDLCRYVHLILASDDSISTLANDDIGILRVTDIRNPYFEGADGNYEANPNFDITFTHNVLLSKTIDAVDTFDYTIKGV